MGKVELAVVGSGFAPREDVFAVGIHAVDARVSVSIRDEDITSGGVYCGVGWAVEHLAALARDLFARSDGQ